MNIDQYIKDKRNESRRWGCMAVLFSISAVCWLLSIAAEQCSSDPAAEETVPEKTSPEEVVRYVSQDGLCYAVWSDGQKANIPCDKVPKEVSKEVSK